MIFCNFSIVTFSPNSVEKFLSSAFHIFQLSTLNLSNNISTGVKCVDHNGDREVLKFKELGYTGSNNLEILPSLENLTLAMPAVAPKNDNPAEKAYEKTLSVRISKLMPS